MTLTMQIDEILKKRKQSIDYSSIDHRNKTNTSIDNSSIDRVLDSYPQLVVENYRGWHANKVRQLGTAKYIELAERAIKYGKNPQSLFSSMLKKY